MTLAKLPPEIRSAFDNGNPSVVVSCSKDGIPNTTVISKVYWVSETRVALSFQFFNKTIKNVRENPHVSLQLSDFSGCLWNLMLRYDHSETEGPIFDEMDMQIEAIASMTGMSGIFKLKAADVYDVLDCTRIAVS